MTFPLPVRTSLEQLAESLGVTLPDLSDDEILSIAEIMVREHGTTFSASFLDLNRIVNRVIDGRVPTSCCEGEVYAGPSGPRLRHTRSCRDHRWGQPHDREFEIAAKVAKVIAIEGRRPRHVHPGCKAAWDSQEATPCWRCLPLLCGREDCSHDACRYFEAHADDDDDRRRADL